MVTIAERFHGPKGSANGGYACASWICPRRLVTDLFGEVGVILLGRLAADLERPIVAGDGRNGVL